MKKFKGTKGKWEIDSFYNNFETIITSNGTRICDVKHYNQGEQDWTKNDPTKEEGKANAMLILKAPEMLEMLELMLNNSDVPNEIFDKAKQLIKEATEI